MARQGCRNQRGWQRERITLAFIASFIWTCSAHSPHGQAAEGPIASPPAVQASPRDVDYRLELTWKSTSPRVWAGGVFVSAPTDLQPLPNRLWEPANLTPGMLLSGGIRIPESADSLTFTPSPSTSHLRDRDGRFVAQQTTTGGVAFRIRAKADERVVIAVRRDDSHETTVPVAINLKELERGEPIENTFSNTASWQIRRVEGDRLRVSLMLESAKISPDKGLKGTSLFWDDQKATIAVTCDAVNNDVFELVCNTFANGHAVVATQSWPITFVNGHGIVTDAMWQPPKGDASYEIRWRLQRKSTVRSLMGVSVPRNVTHSITKPITMIRGSSESNVIAESVSHVMVLSRQPFQPSVVSLDSESIVGRIEPFGRSWSLSRLMPMRPANPFNTASVHVVDLKKGSMHNKVVAELAPGAYWQHTLPIAKVGIRHRVLVHLPADKPITLGVCVLDRTYPEDRLSVMQDVTAVHLQSSPNDPLWRTVAVDFHPRSLSTQLVLVNRDDTVSAFFEAIDVEMVAPQDTASTVSPTRESKPTRNALFSQTASQWLRWFDGGIRDENSVHSIGHRHMDAAIRLVEFIRAEGYSGLMMTVCEDGMSLYPTSIFTNERAHANDVASVDTLEMLMRLFDRESLQFVPCIRLNQPMTKLEQAIAVGNASSRGVAVSTPWTGQSLEISLGEIESASCGLYNPTNELVQEQIALAVEELARNCNGHRCVGSIGVMMDEGSCLCIPPERAMLDNETLDRFHASLPAGTVARSQLISWIAEEGIDHFKQWREKQLQSLCTRLILAAANNVGKLVVVTTSQQPPSYLVPLLDDPRFLMTRLYRRSPIEPLALRCRDEQVSNVTLVNRESGKEQSLTGALFIAPESELPSSEREKRWREPNGISTSVRTSPYMDTESSSLAFSHLLGRSDRLAVALSDGFSTSSSDVRRRSLRRFQTLPPVLMSDVAGSGDAMKFVKLRTASYDGATYFSVINDSRWPVTVEAILSEYAGAESLIASDLHSDVGPGGVWKASLAAGELVVLRVPVAECTVRRWSAQLQGGANRLSDIVAEVRLIADSIGLRTEPTHCECLENASFEEVRSPVQTDEYANASGKPAAVSPSPVTVPGWLMAQHPAGCAAIDSEVAFDGKHSIRLRNQDGRPGGTWIVSRAIEPPASGRLAVSFMVRGEPSENPNESEPIIIRIAIEGAVAGSTLRESRQIKVRRDGKWGNGQVVKIPCRLEVASLPRWGMESLRLAIDVMNEGTVWIDDVHAENAFMSESEKTHLQSQLFLALGGLAKGELTHAAKLVESHWVQQRLGAPSELGSATISTSTSTSVAETPIQRGDAQTDAQNAPKAVPPAEPLAAPGIAERLKGWLPRPVRF